jgi:hypothetical protein
MATGRTLVVAPENDRLRLSIISHTGNLLLLDGRYQHNNCWFVVRSEVAPGASTRAIEWELTPHVNAGWSREPAVIVSQVGYHPAQTKKDFIETVKNDPVHEQVQLIRVGEDGAHRTVCIGNRGTVGNGGIRGEPGRLVLYPGGSDFRDRPDPTRLSGAARLALPVATAGICNGRRIA